MHYKEVILDDYIDSFQKSHRIVYGNLLRIQFCLEFLETANDKLIQPTSLYWYLLELVEHEWEYLILLLQRCLFDTVGNAYTLNSFISEVRNKYIRPEYRDYINELIRMSLWQSSDIKGLKNEIKPILYAFRTHIAHTLNEDLVADALELKKIRSLYEAARDMFQRLSFEPNDFYLSAEGDGHTFDETEMRKMTREFFDACITVRINE